MGAAYFSDRKRGAAVLVMHPTERDTVAAALDHYAEHAHTMAATVTDPENRRGWWRIACEADALARKLEQVEP